MSYAVSHMCGKISIWNLGWRNYMEDASISISPLSDNKNSLFAVFDGHGGKVYHNLRRIGRSICLKALC